MTRTLQPRQVISLGFAMALLSGALLIGLGTQGPVWFTAAIIPIIPAGPMLRPPGVNLMLEQQELEDAGSASSLINAAPFFFGGAGMLLISLVMERPILWLSLMCLAVGAVTTTLWGLSARRDFIASVLDRR
jgi:DHA1 family bicyclomycin/chloramphenicol resistance-like MFS transporter